MRGKSRCEDCQFFDYDEETDSNDEAAVPEEK